MEKEIKVKKKEKIINRKNTFTAFFLRIFIYSKKSLPIEIGLLFIVFFLTTGFIFSYISANALEISEKISPTPPEVTPSLITSFESEIIPIERKIEKSLLISLTQDIEKSFYVSLVRNNLHIVNTVYKYTNDLDRNLIFAMILNESSGDPRAININKDAKGNVKSIDRGLFQLNSNSYPRLTIEDFYNIDTNTKYGTAHIRGELVYWKGNIRKALWTYNAGRRGILNGVPKKTIEYANRIIEASIIIQINKEKYIEKKLNEYILNQ